MWGSLSSSKVVAAALASLALGLAEGQARKEGDSTLLLGAVMPMSSHQGGAGISFVRGASTAVKAVNAGGGIAGKIVTLRIENDEGNSVDAAEFTTELVKSGALAILGGSGEATIQSMSLVARKSRVAVIGGVACSPQQRVSLADTLWTPRLSDVETAKAIARNLGDLNRRRVVVLTGRESASLARSAVYLKALQSAGGFEQKQVEIGEKAIQSASALPEIAAFRPDAVLLLTGYEAAADLIKSARAAGNQFNFYLTSDVGTASITARLGNGIKGVTLLSTTPIASDNKSQIVRQFRQDMTAHAAGVAPDELALEGYISARLALEAIRRSGKNPNSEQVRRVLANEAIELGEITFRQTSTGTVLNIRPELAIFSSDGKLIY